MGSVISTPRVHCDRCEQWFADDRALEQHKEDSDSHWACDDCDLDFDFESYGSLMQHYIQSRNHHYCKDCDKHFISEEFRRQHMDDKHWYCRKHDQDFKSEAGLHSHYRESLDHHFCFECKVDFDDEDGLWDHLEDDHHGCLDCRKLFDSYSDLREHDHSVHTHCTECDRDFQDQHSLQQHLKSKLHLPSNIPCPGRKCTKSFISPAALTHHFESGACRSGMTREKLNRVVVRADNNNYITNTSRLIGGPPGGYEPPMSASSWATELSWNGIEFECFLCHSTFKTIDRLNQHLQSPRHDEKIYRCPKPDCLVEFVTLSALCQHVESGSCGVMMFKQVQNTMDSLTRGFNAITI